MSTVTLPQHLFQNKSLTLSVTFNIIVKRLFWISSICNWCFRMSTGSLPQQFIQNKYPKANAAVSVFFSIVVNFKRFAFAVFTLDLIWPLCHRSSFKTHPSHSQWLTGYIPTCYRHCKYKNHRRKLIFSSSLFSTQMLDFLAPFRPKANMPPFQIINSVLLKRFHCDFPIPWLTRIHSVWQSHIFGYILNERVKHRGNIFLR